MRKHDSVRGLWCTGRVQLANINGLNLGEGGGIYPNRLPPSPSFLPPSPKSCLKWGHEAEIPPPPPDSLNLSHLQHAVPLPQAICSVTEHFAAQELSQRWTRSGVSREQREHEGRLAWLLLQEGGRQHAAVHLRQHLNNASGGGREEGRRKIPSQRNLKTVHSCEILCLQAPSSPTSANQQSIIYPHCCFSYHNSVS